MRNVRAEIQPILRRVLSKEVLFAVFLDGNFDEFDTPPVLDSFGKLRPGAGSQRVGQSLSVGQTIAP